MTPEFNLEDVRATVKRVVKAFENTGWEYLVKQFPILLDDRLSVADQMGLDDNDSCSFANQSYIGFSESRFMEQTSAWYEDKGVIYTYAEMERNVKNTLTHELGHIMMEHVFENPLRGELNRASQIVTHEIETNRGVPYDNRGGWFNDIIISDDKEEWGTVKPLITRQAIFNEVKRLAPKMKKPKDNQKQNNNSSQGQGNNQKNDKKQDGNGKTSSAPSSSRGSQNKGQEDKQKEKQFKQPNVIDMMAQANNGQQDKKETQSDLLTELGMNPSKDFKNTRDVNERLKIMTKLVENDKIRKALYKIKGTLAGTISKGKVSTYSRPSRKVGEDGLMKRGVKRGPNKAPKILVALDESGSMDITAVQTAATAVKIVSRTIGRNRSDVHLCKFANSVTDIEPLRNADRLVRSYSPYGGTNFFTVVRQAIDLGVDVILCIGDGYDRLPSNDEIKNWYGNKDDIKVPKWVDVLITPNVDCVNRVVENEYTSEDRKLGRRETYWLGDDSGRIEKMVGDL